MKTLFLCLLAALAVAGFAACGGSEDDSSSDETPDAATEEAVEPAEDETDLARSLLLTVEDFPTGWAEEPSEDEDSPLDECDPEDAEGKTGEAETGDFSAGNGLTVSHTVAIFNEAGEVTGSLGRIDAIAECFIEKVNEGALDDSEAEFSDASFSPLSFPTKGDESRAYRLKFHAKAKGESGLGSEGDIYFDIVYTRIGRIGISVIALDTFTAPDPQEWEPYVDIAVARAEQAQ